MVLFSSNDCPYCFLVEEFLKDRDIEFEKVLVDEDEEKKKYLVEKLGQRTLPVTEVDGKVVAGYDKDKLGKLLEISV